MKLSSPGGANGRTIPARDGRSVFLKSWTDSRK